MKLKDERLKLTNEVLNGIRVVKLYAWEQPMMDQINEIRKQEVGLIRRAQLTRSIGDILNVASPFLVSEIQSSCMHCWRILTFSSIVIFQVSIVAFTLFTLSSADNILTPQVAFVSLTVFAQLRLPLFMIADLIGQTVQIVVSNKRLKEFLVDEEVDDDAVVRDSLDNCKLINCNFLKLRIQPIVFYFSRTCHRCRNGYIHLG